MSYPDFPKQKSYSWLNIILILVCVLMFAFSIYFLNNPESYNQLIKRFNIAQNLSLTPPKEINDSKPVKQPVEVISTPTVSNTLHPVEPLKTDSSLPLLEQSDNFVLSQINDFSNQPLLKVKALQHAIIESTIVFIDNFSRGDFISRFSPLLAPKTSFKVYKVDDKTYMSQLSYQRYNEYSNYIAGLDTDKFINTYKKLKPLIDESYAEIGRPNTSFDVVLNDAINMALSVSVIEHPILLHSPSVMYLFSDSKLENLNDAQKFLLRLGPVNLSKIQTKLKAIQIALNELQINQSNVIVEPTEDNQPTDSTSNQVIDESTNKVNSMPSHNALAIEPIKGPITIDNGIVIIDSTSGALPTMPITINSTTLIDPHSSALTTETINDALTIESISSALATETIDEAVTIEAISSDLATQTINDGLTISPISSALATETINDVATIKPTSNAIATNDTETIKTLSNALTTDTIIQPETIELPTETQVSEPTN